MANRSNAVSTEQRKLSLDPQTDRVLEEMATAGIYGKNAGEVASYILRTWLRENRAELADFGITLVKRLRRRRIK